MSISLNTFSIPHKIEQTTGQEKLITNQFVFSFSCLTDLEVYRGMDMNISKCFINKCM